MAENILITGASSGLGEGLARGLAARGHNLALLARRLDRLEAIAEDIRAAHGVTVVVRQLDVGDSEAVFRTFRETDEALGGLDRIVANAGIGKGQPLGTGNYAANAETASINFLGTLAQCEAALELFRPRGAGHLVINASFSALRGFGGNATTYAASKAAVAHLAEGIRVDLAGSKIRVTTLMPGFIESEMTAGLRSVPLMTSASKGHAAMVAAVLSGKKVAYVPGWPWAALAPLVKVAPEWLLGRLMG